MKGVNLTTEKQQPEKHNVNVQWGSCWLWALGLCCLLHQLLVCGEKIPQTPLTQTLRIKIELVLLSLKLPWI